MTTEEKDRLFEQTDKVLEIFEQNQPIKSDGTFEIEQVKKTVTEIADILIENKESEKKFLEWMDTHEFWTSPASARFHGNVKGGLAGHSLLVVKQAFFYAKSFAENFMSSKRADKFTFSASDIFISAIAHDFCKAGSYNLESRKTKDIKGNWKYEPFYKVKTDWRNLGHGNESVLLLLETIPEALQNRTLIEAISRHMGFSDLSDMERINFSLFMQNPLVVLIQLADETAAQWWDL